MRGYHVALTALLLAEGAGSALATNLSAAGASTPSADAVPLDRIPAALREDVRQVVARPTLAARGPAETFPCKAEQYLWLLDHPDRAVTAWRRLGAKCVSIVNEGNGLFGWADDMGSAVTWQTIYSDAAKRIWFASGKVRPAAMLPLVPVRVVVVLHHQQRPAPAKSAARTLIQHRADMFLHTDSKTAALVTRMLGASAPRLAEQGLGQLQMFFSALSSYLERHPDEATVLLRAE